MIKYMTSTKTFESKFKSYTLGEVTETLVYQWVKTGELSLPDFKKWYSSKVSAAYDSGKMDFVSKF